MSTAPDERAAEFDGIAAKILTDWEVAHGGWHEANWVDLKHRIAAEIATHARRLEYAENEGRRLSDVATFQLERAIDLERRLEEARAALASSRREREDWGQQIEGHLLYAPPLRCPVCASADEGVRAMVGCPCLPTCAEREENYRAALALARLSPPPPRGEA